MKTLLYIFAFALISCASTQINKIDNSDLVGTWNWTNTDGGFGNHIHKTPETLNKNVQLTLLKNNQFSISKNDSLISKGTYTLEMKKAIYSNKQERFIQLSNDQQFSGIVLSGIIRFIKPNTLEISDNNYDGLGSRFVKLN
ncbi:MULTISPECIES: hypothetical protein [Tenacibaculum]|uniref:Lipocalin-like domain-containing protein n=1 Tax=Tenacibaculum mesophilum TaxID=104268 RepID=A0ABM7CGN1_9FLAO|nr:MULTISPECIES: hypothetical protein [Tenacibaculum]GFD91476.1 hypothetical protein KUL154_02090 [Alteromonas sp. KUL154]GFE01459.1 hypothetical protein KUL156_40510 [Alteromonas sp. KUL156]AZJ32958.1 hypothetical protein D6200_10495 [Tenacibaculum mesophilum]MCG7500836.1 hypothetical protein [Tenacibaculum sp. Mcav3-52]MCO7184121.1 hypothetical protein [Tenacibaculum sp. XPcli2-G]